MKVEPLILEGDCVRLEPLCAAHVEKLCAAGLDETIWRWSPQQITTPAEMSSYVETALAEFERGISLPFVVMEKSSGIVAGSTRFGNIDVKNRKVEIGWTWLNPSWQRTAINTEAKLLLLKHAFETWRCIRVELKTDFLNEKSKNAILRLGARQEGVLRRHMITDSGRFRDTVYFSIIDAEWREVEINLMTRLKKIR